MNQTAPYPAILADLVSNLHYREGWLFRLADLERDQDHGRGKAGGLTLIVTTLTTNSYHPEDTDYRVNHYFIVPAATYDERAWTRWLFDKVVDVETHEAAEFFRLVVDPGEDMATYERPMAPIHAPGANPYTIVEYATHEERRTSYRGKVNA